MGTGGAFFFAWPKVWSGRDQTGRLHTCGPNGRPPGTSQGVQKVMAACPMRNADRSDSLPPNRPSRERRTYTSGRAAARKVILARQAVCGACDHFNGALCEAQFPTGCCLTTWSQFVAQETCPLGKWA